MLFRVLQKDCHCADAYSSPVPLSLPSGSFQVSTGRRFHLALQCVIWKVSGPCQKRNLRTRTIVRTPRYLGHRNRETTCSWCRNTSGVCPAKCRREGVLTGEIHQRVSRSYAAFSQSSSFNVFSISSISAAISCIRRLASMRSNRIFLYAAKNLSPFLMAGIIPAFTIVKG